MKSCEFIDDRKEELGSQKAVKPFINDVSFERFIKYIESNGFREINQYCDSMPEKVTPIQFVI